jgi:hypothetical protein
VTKDRIASLLGGYLQTNSWQEQSPRALYRHLCGMMTARRS